MGITRISVANPVFATMMMVAFMVLGVFSYQRLSVDQMPNVDIPIAVVTTPYPGASAEVVEQEITRRVEDAINTIQGVKTIRSYSSEGFSRVVAEFQLNVDAKAAVQDVRDKVAQVRRSFNRDVGEPTVLRADNDDDQPILYLSLRSDSRSLRELSDLAERLVVKRLQGAEGVGNIDVFGDVRRELAVWLKPEKMAAYGVGIDQIVAAIRAENQDAPAGALVSEKTERLVQVKGKIRTPEEFERIIIARRGAGASTVAVTLGQLADVRDSQREETSIATVDGNRSISIQVRKTRGANTIDTGDAVKKNMEDLRKSLPPDILLDVSWDRSAGIKASVNNVRSTILEGALLTVLIVFLFLHSWRSTVITGLTLPISVLAAFIALYAFGFTINFLTLLALSLSIGVLIDDAIVVRENIVRHLAMGTAHRQAALDGTNEIGLAVMATTFTLVAVFMPVAFMGGEMGRYFYQFGVTVTVAVLVSLFVSFTLDPMLSSVWHDPPARWLTHGPVGWVLRKQQAMMDWIHARYDRWLRWALRRRKTTLAIAAAIFFASFALVPLIGSEYFPRTDESWTNVRIQTPVGSSLAYTASKADQVQEVLKTFPEIERITRSVSKTGAWFGIRLADKSQRKRSQAEIDDAIRRRLSSIAGLDVNIGWNRPLRVHVMGPDVNELNRIASEAIERMKKVPGVVEVESSYKPTTPSLDIVVNRELASDLGVSMYQIAATTRALIGGEPAGQWEGPDGENHQVMLRLPRDQRTGIADLDRIYVASYSFNNDATPRMVPLRQVAEFRPAVIERQIERRNLSRQIQVSAGITRDVKAGEVSVQLKDVLRDLALPPGYRIEFGGETQDMQESIGYAAAALGLAIIFIYLILASQFGSYLQPLAIMASLPLSLIGVFLALLAFGTTLNIFSVIGLIMLMGLVTKNAILLVDFTNQGILEGKTREQAILDAGQVRLRPILMTSAAMVFGMLPLALSLGAGSEQQSPMAHAVIGGIITSTALTLVVVPVLYTYVDAWGRAVRDRMAAQGGKTRAGSTVTDHSESGEPVTPVV
jgi:HAE1 family hydrophobic/amphiphilic exporter-1